jgi:hypothetical protein
MIRLSQICLAAFLATLGIFIYQVQTRADYSLAFLMMGAAGCLWLLLRTEQRYSQLTRHRETPARPDRSEIKRIAPQVTATGQLTERRAIPALSRTHAHKPTAASGK